MLVLSRTAGESIDLFGPGLPEEGIKITICQIRGTKVRLGIDAPRAIDVLRTELVAVSGVPEYLTPGESPGANCSDSPGANCGESPGANSSAAG